MYTRTFLIEGKYYGQADIPELSFGQRLHPPHSTLFYCKQCGAMYAQCPTKRGFDGKLMSWQALAGICKRCEPEFPWEIPGSIWLVWNKSSTAFLSQEIMERELILAIDNYKPREEDDGQDMENEEHFCSLD